MSADEKELEALRLLTESPTDEEYERLTLAYWGAKVPEMDSVTVIVRKHGEPAASLWLEPATPPYASSGPPRP